MTLFSLICCLLALSSTAYGRHTAVGYGGYSATQLPETPKLAVLREQQPIAVQLPTQVQTGYGQSVGYGAQLPRTLQLAQTEPAILTPTGYGVHTLNTQLVRPVASPNQLLLEQQQLLAQKIQENTPVTDADLRCRGQPPETIIALSDPRKYIVCLDDGKGEEQECPQGLHYRPDTNRCEHKFTRLANLCESQPCLNGGQCYQEEATTFKCRCPANFEGKTCELDARVCQTQQPCGLSPDTKCQSFRLGAALSHACIFQNGRAYGLNTQQVLPNPCQGIDGPQPLGVSEKGFLMCDGEFMFIESCPGGTLWDDLNKACVWPDMQGVITGGYVSAVHPQRGQGHQQHRTLALQSGYGDAQLGYGASYQAQRPLPVEEQRPTLSYGQSSGQFSGQQLGQLSGQQLGQSSGQLSGQGFGQQLGQSSGQLSGQGLGQQFGQSSGQQLGQQLGQHSGQQLGQHSGQQLGQHSGQQLGQHSGQQLGQLSGQQSFGQGPQDQSQFQQQSGHRLQSHHQQGQRSMQQFSQ